jgi:hypothetical protein
MFYVEYSLLWASLVIFWLPQYLKLKKKICGFFFYIVRKSVESPGKCVQVLSGMLLLGNQNTNRRFEKALSLANS